MEVLISKRPAWKRTGCESTFKTYLNLGANHFFFAGRMVHEGEDLRVIQCSPLFLTWTL